MAKEKVYGYIRVSSKDQNEARQIKALRDFGVLEENFYMDKLSGKDFNRPAYKELLRTLKKGDTVVVKSIDRLGRNYTEIIEQWNYISKRKKCYIVVLDMPLLDTRQGKDLTGTFIADLVLQILSYVAETERENIKQRQAEGIKVAKDRGVQFGRPHIELDKQFAELKELWVAGKITSREAGRILGISHQTFLRRVKESVE